jgi:hypothetical protein
VKISIADPEARFAHDDPGIGGKSRQERWSCRGIPKRENGGEHAGALAVLAGA